MWRYDGSSFAVDPAQRAQISDPRQQALLAQIDSRTKQAALGKIAVLPAIMLVCYLILIGYFKAKGGYRAEQLTVGGVGHGGWKSKKGRDNSRALRGGDCP